MIFRDRQHAGVLLAKELERYRGEKVLVLAIPKGGVVIGYEIARHLNAELSMVIVRKLPYPREPESGFGAVAENGSIFIFPWATGMLNREQINRILDYQEKEIKRRIKDLRGNKPLPDLTGKTVILVDDGLAMGSTMRAAIQLCRQERTRKIIAAVPVAGRNTVEEVKPLVDDLIVLETPDFFQAVAQGYCNWYDVGDDEVVRLMRSWQEFKAKTN